MKRLYAKIQRLQKELRLYKKLAIVDTLTCLYNRRKLEEDLQRYIELNERHNINFSVMMIDINDFKEINDTRGHRVGDKVLREVGRCLQNNIRKSDRAYRLAGDEFIIVFSHHKNKKAIVSRIRKALEDINIHISIGYCDLKDKFARDIIDVIDKRIYEEKRKC